MRAFIKIPPTGFLFNFGFNDINGWHAAMLCMHPDAIGPKFMSLSKLKLEI
jgi:hypothetical protein